MSDNRFSLAARAGIARIPDRIPSIAPFALLTPRIFTVRLAVSPRKRRVEESNVESIRLLARNYEIRPDMLLSYEEKRKVTRKMPILYERDVIGCSYLLLHEVPS
jgi:hypothetical protein